MRKVTLGAGLAIVSLVGLGAGLLGYLLGQSIGWDNGYEDALDSTVFNPAE